VKYSDYFKAEYGYYSLIFMAACLFLFGFNIWLDSKRSGKILTKRSQEMELKSITLDEQIQLEVERYKSHSIRNWFASLNDLVLGLCSFFIPGIVAIYCVLILFTIDYYVLHFIGYSVIFYGVIHIATLRANEGVLAYSPIFFLVFLSFIIGFFTILFRLAIELYFTYT
tara:strand:- start:362 stop:868 length:507 start_codon:yes stop_codon:yes gene_type:complete